MKETGEQRVLLATILFVYAKGSYFRAGKSCPNEFARTVNHITLHSKRLMPRGKLGCLMYPSLMNILKDS